MSAGDGFIPDEVAAAYRLSRVFHCAHPWRGVECGIERAAQDALAPNRGPHGGDGDDRADPRDRAGETAHQTAACVLRHLLSECHKDVSSKVYSKAHAQSWLALCTLTSAGFRTPGRVIRWRPVGRFCFVNARSFTGFPILEDSCSAWTILTSCS